MFSIWIKSWHRFWWCPVDLQNQQLAQSSQFSNSDTGKPPGCASVPVFVYKFCKLQQERHQQTQQTPATFSAWKVSGATSLLLTSGMPAHVCAPFMLEFVMFLEWGVVKVLSIWFHMVFASCLELALPTVLDHLTWSKPVITLCTWAQWSKCRQRAWCVLVLSCVWLDSKLQSQDWRPAY